MTLKISLIIPTYNETSNIKPLFKRIHSVLKDINYEAILVDDNSPDGTAKKAKSLVKKYPLRVIIRKKDRDLSRAVVTGFKAAKGNIIGVIDADLAHPTESIPLMLNILNKNAADLVIGSRQIEGGKIENWPMNRRFVSKLASVLARPLTNVHDPMSGFFLMKREVIKNAPLKPRGYKILLEILVKGNYSKVIEIPIIFRDRLEGQSKLSAKVYLKYLIQLIGLYCWKIKSLTTVKKDLNRVKN